MDALSVWQARYFEGWAAATRLIEGNGVTKDGAREALKSEAWGAFHLGYRSALKAALGE